MTAFRYVAYTGAGKRRRGTLIADTRGQANEQLRAQGLFAESLEANVTASRARPLLRRRTALSSDEQAIFTRQLAVLLAADIPADAALDVVAGAAGTPRIEAAATVARAALREGESLSDALDTGGAGFPPYYLAAMSAGEVSGDLVRVVEELANHLETARGDKARIATALIYPAFVAIVSLLVCAVLVTTVAPQIVGMFEATGQTLPPITVALLATTGWIETYWPWLLGSLIALTAGFRWALARPSFRARWDAVLLRLPLAGRLMRQSAALQYLQTLALVLSSRQTAIDAAESAARVLTVGRFADEGAQVTEAIRRGESLSDGLRRLSVIPPVCRQLIAAGETSARVAKMTERASRLVDSWLENDRKRIAALLDPLLMLIVGGFVLVVVLAILLPIFDMQAVVTVG